MSYKVGEVLYDTDMLIGKIIRKGVVYTVFEDGAFTVKFEDAKLPIMCDNKGWKWNSGKVWKKEEISPKLLMQLQKEGVIS